MGQGLIFTEVDTDRFGGITHLGDVTTEISMQPISVTPEPGLLAHAGAYRQNRTGQVIFGMQPDSEEHTSVRRDCREGDKQIQTWRFDIFDGAQLKGGLDER